MESRMVLKAYEKAKVAAAEGKLDAARVGRALAYATGEKPIVWATSLHTCDCPDHIYRGLACKHMIAEMILFRAQQMEVEEQALDQVFERLARYAA